MRKFAFLTVPLLLLATTAMSLAQQPTPAVQLGLQQSAEFGAFLTDPNGMTLYTFTGDTPGVSNVSGQLEQVWPPLRPLADRGLALPDGVSGDLSVITRADGSPQMAYNGMPLYTFVGDTGPGVVNGQGGANGQFFVATAQLSAAATETETPVAAATETETPVAAATETETPVAAATETPVVAGATPAVATPSVTATAVATTAVATATPAVLAATPSALPSAGSPSDSAPMAALLGALALGLLGAGAFLRYGRATR